MKKFLLSFLCLLATCLIGSAEVKTVDFKWATKDGKDYPFATSGNAYSNHTLETTQYKVDFGNFSKQANTIKDYPVGKNTYIIVSLKENQTFSYVKFTLAQWGTKAKTAELQYSTDGQNFSNFTPSITSTNFSIEAKAIPEGTTAIKLDLTKNSNQVGVVSFEYEITTTDPTKTPAELAFAEKAYSFNLGETFVSPQLVKQICGPVSYSSSNPAVATINAESAELTLVAAGKTTITATSAADNTYNAGEASYELTVVDPNAPVEIYYSSMCAEFSTENPSGTEIWKHNELYGLTANGYINNAKVVSDNVMAISPVIDCSEYRDLSLYFNQGMNFFNSTTQEEIGQWLNIKVREEGSTSWTQLMVPNIPKSYGNEFYLSDLFDLSAYDNKKIQIGFSYSSSTEIAGRWQIKELVINGKKGKAEIKLGEITVNDIIAEDSSEYSFETGKEIKFVSTNAEMLAVTISDESNKNIVNETLESDNYTWTPTVTGQYIASIESILGDDSKNVEFFLNVTEPLKDMTLSFEPENITLKKLEPFKLNPILKDGETSIDEYIIIFEAPEGVTIDEDTYTVTLPDFGQYTITATAAADGYRDATATFTVIAENPFGTKREVYTDVLDYQFLLGNTKEGTTYATKTDLKKTESGITYSAMLQPTKNSNGTQYYSIRTDKNTSGIVVTANEKGLVFKGIKVHFASACTNDRTIDVYYASDEKAFTNPSELYDISSNTKEITKYSTSLTRSDKDIAETHEMIPGVEVTAEKNHQFIGIRSNKNAIQISKIEITWQTVQPELTFAEAADFEVDHNFQPYEENSGKHHAEHAIDGIQLYEEKYHEAVKATITHDETAWKHAFNPDNGRPGYITEVPGNLTDEEAEAFHKEHHYDFFVAPEVSDFNTNFVNFNASHAGKYLLTLDVNDEYKDYLDCTPKTYVINVKPSFSTEGFTVDAGTADSNNGIAYAPDALNELRLFVTKEENGEVNGYNVAVYTDKGWQLSATHDLSQVFIDARYRNLYYQIENGDANNSDPEFRPAAKAEAQAMPEGYIHYDARKGIDLSNAKSLSLIAVENGVKSAPSTFAFNDEKIETAVEEIETENLPTEYYSIEGIRVEAPLAPGIYVARRGADAKVIMVK